MVSSCTPPSMLSAYWFHLPSICLFLPPVSISLPLGFYQICHDISSGWSEYKSSSFLEMGQQVALLPGLTCPEGDSQCAIQNFPSRHSPVHCHLQNHQQSSLSSQGDATIIETLRGPFLPILGDGSWRSSLARRKGVSETAGAQVGFAKRLITRPGIVPTSHMVSQPASLHLVS